MSPEFQQRIGQREKRIVLLRGLVDVLQKAQQTLLAGDIKGMQLYTTQAHALSAEVLELARAEAAPLPALKDNNAWERWEKSAREVQELESRARHLGRVQAVLLQRGRRALEIYACLLATLAPTYSPPGRALARR